MVSRARGFTLIEILVVIAIIGILASLVLGGLNLSRKKADDATRKQNLSEIRKAMHLYYDKYGHFMTVPGAGSSGCGGGNGEGLGWFNFSNGGSYPVSMGQCLVNEGFTPTEIMDPTGARSGSTAINTVYAYMKYTCTTGATPGTYLMAKLETEPQSTTATDLTCVNSNDYDTLYGMNYVLKVD